MGAVNHGFIFHRSHFYNWIALSFVAGTLNVGALMACGRFVTHVTGFASLFGENLALGRFAVAASIISVPVFFLLGGFISGLLIDLKITQKKRPQYGLAMALVTLCVAVAGGGGVLGWFGAWGSEVELTNNYLFLVCLALGSGIQNALVTSASGTVVRTTHLTGITTDLGIGLARVLFGKFDEKQLLHENRGNLLRASSITTFILGSGIGAFTFMRFGYSGFLLPLIALAYLTLIAKFHWEKNLHPDLIDER